MRIEQRIGRVDRIGQKQLVKAFNLIFEDSVELRVQEVLETKLQTILEEFGVDKASDVLDSAEAGAGFERLYAGAILDPTTSARRSTHCFLSSGPVRKLRREGAGILGDRPEYRPASGARILRPPAAELGRADDDRLSRVRRAESRYAISFRGTSPGLMASVTPGAVFPPEAG